MHENLFPPVWEKEQKYSQVVVRWFGIYFEVELVNVALGRDGEYVRVDKLIKPSLILTRGKLSEIFDCPPVSQTDCLSSGIKFDRRN